MPTSGERRYAVDTSVAVPAVDAGHAAHEACRTVVVARRTYDLLGIDYELVGLADT